MCSFHMEGHEEPALDHAELAISQFAQSIAYAPIVQPVDFKQMVESGVIAFLVHVCNTHNKSKVVGPAALALSHMSRDDESKREVANIGGVRQLLLLMKVIDKEPVLSQVCRTIASIALVDTIKVQIAAQGGIKVLVYQITFIKDDDLQIFCKLRTPAAQAATLHALVNVCHNNDANRIAIATAGSVPHLVELMGTSDDPEVLEQTGKLLANLAYNNNGNQALIASAKADDTFIRTLAPEYPAAVHMAVGIAVANLVHSERNQAQVGSGEAPVSMIHLLNTSKDVSVLHACAMAIGALAYQSFLNKNRVVEKGAHFALTKLLDNPICTENKQCLVMVCRVIATVGLTESNQREFARADVITPLVRICKTSNVAEVMEAAAMALVSQAPDVETKKRFEEEGRLIPFLVVGGLPALQRVQTKLFAQTPPPWLFNAVQTLTAPAGSVPPVVSPLNLFFSQPCFSDEPFQPTARRWSEMYPRNFLSYELFSEIEKTEDERPQVEFQSEHEQL